jgi:hypothetical protein
MVEGETAAVVVVVDADGAAAGEEDAGDSGGTGAASKRKAPGVSAEPSSHWFEKPLRTATPVAVPARSTTVNRAGTKFRRFFDGGSGCGPSGPVRTTKSSSAAKRVTMAPWGSAGSETNGLSSRSIGWVES